jgi:hypothetical protein
MNEDRRKHERQLVRLQAEITEPRIGKVTVFTQDISEGGAFVVLPAERCPPVGSAVNIRLPGERWGCETATFTARVVRVSPNGMGLQFFDFDTE